MHCASHPETFRLPVFSRITITYLLLPPDVLSAKDG